MDIRQKRSTGTTERNIFLPAEEFVYGKKNRTPTPVKNVINQEYSRQAEEVIKQEYSNFMTEKTRIEKLQPKTTKHFDKMEEKRRNRKAEEEKPLYKMRMFRDANSKVKEGIKNFKSSQSRDHLDSLINKVENELIELEGNQMNNEQIVA